MCLIALFLSPQSTVIDPQDYDFAELDQHITLVEDDMSGLTAAEKDPVELARVYKWITRRGYVLTLLLIFVWPILSIPAGVFSKNYFAFWVLVSIAWGFGATIFITVLPLTESSEDILRVFNGMYLAVTGKTSESEPESESEVATKEVDLEDESASKDDIPAKAEEGAVEVST